MTVKRGYGFTVIFMHTGIQMKNVIKLTNVSSLTGARRTSRR